MSIFTNLLIWFDFNLVCLVCSRLSLTDLYFLTRINASFVCRLCLRLEFADFARAVEPIHLGCQHDRLLDDFPLLLLRPVELGVAVERKQRRFRFFSMLWERA